MKKWFNRYGVIILIAIPLLLLYGCTGSNSGTDKKMTGNEANAGQEALAASGTDKGNETADSSGEGNVAATLPGEDGIAFSQNGYFYSEDLELEIMSKRLCTIYYTTDGADPDRSKKQYIKPINLAAGEEAKAVCIKARGYFDDGTETNDIVHTYFLGRNIENRYDTLIFSITSDPYNLYDYEYGILVEGKLRDDWIRENPYDIIEPNDPANFNMRGRESEREAFIEVIEPDGTGVVSQKAGIRTYGGWSRANLQKSIKMFARKEYDEENNKFRYAFFPDKRAACGDKTVPDTYKRLVLRNCGNDNGFAFIRDELFQTLAAQAGYPDYQAVRPAVMYVNGDYRGVFWLHDVYWDEYFEDNYGKYKGTMEVLEGGETYKKKDDDGENAVAVDDYQDMYYKYSRTDLTEDAAYEELCRLIDVENYLSYYALQIYIGNEDWPHNNYKTYRYYATEGEAYSEAPFDGRWRYLLHDLDFSFGIYGTGALVDNIHNYAGKNGEVKEPCPLFGQLMRRPECREIFITKTLDLINGAFAPDNINKVLEEMNALRINEQMNMYDKYLIADWVRFDQLEERLEDIRVYGMQRADHIVKKYMDYFSLSGTYQLTVIPSEGSKVKINTYLTEDAFEGTYYLDYPTVITAVLPEGMEFDCWIVNGNQVEEELLVLTPELLSDNLVDVTCIVR